MGRKKRTDLAKATDYREYKVTVRDGLIGYGIGLAAGFLVLYRILFKRKDIIN